MADGTQAAGVPLASLWSGPQAQPMPLANAPQTPDPRPLVPGLTQLPLSAIRDHPNLSKYCQTAAMQSLARLQDEGINGRLVVGFVRNPPPNMPVQDQGHVVVAYTDPLTGTLMGLDPRTSSDPQSWGELGKLYSWAAQEQ